MDGPLVLIGGIIILGLSFVVLPVVYDAYAKYRQRKVITCPETNGPAELSFDAPRAAVGAAFGKSIIQLKGCSLWPKRIDCERRCLKESPSAF